MHIYALFGFLQHIYYLIVWMPKRIFFQLLVQGPPSFDFQRDTTGTVPIF